MVALMVVVLDEDCDLRFQVAGQIIILQQDAVLQVWCQRSILPWVWG